MAIGVRSEHPGSRDAAGAAEAITEVTQGMRLKYEPTVQQISSVLKTNFPFSATLLPFLRFFRVLRSFSCSAICLRAVTSSLCVIS